MNMPHAYPDAITLSYGPHAIALRPSLRAASFLERLHDGFPALVGKIEEFDTKTIAAIITATADREAAQALFIYASKHPLATFRQATQAPLIALVTALLPRPKETPKGTASASTAAHDPQPWKDVFADLYGLATGWLGWTPDTAWHATPQEITDAFTAHVEKLKAIHGAAEDDEDTASTSATYSTDQLQQIEEQGHDPAFDRGALHALKGQGGGSMT